MARQRFIHPEFWTDPAIGKLSPIERLLFIGCFSNADDEGRLLGNPAFLRATIFPYDDLPLQEVKAMRDRMVQVCKNLVLYEVDGNEYLAFLKWDKYQKPKYPKPSKLPPPPGPSSQTIQNTEACAEPFPQIGETLPQSGGNDGESMEKDLPPGMGLGWDGMGLGRDGLGAPNQGSDASPNLNEPEPKANGQKPKEAKKIKYAEYVSMTEAEYQTLVERYGEDATRRMIETLDNYKGAHGRRYKSDYRAILTWVADKVLGGGDKRNGAARDSPAKAQRKTGPDIDYRKAYEDW